MIGRPSCSVRAALVVALAAWSGLACTSRDPGGTSPSDAAPVESSPRGDAPAPPDGAAAEAAAPAPVDGAGVATVDPMVDAAAEAAPAPSDDAGPGSPDVTPTPPDDLGYLERAVPVLWITVAGRPIPRDLKVAGRLRVIEDHDGSHQDLTARPTTLDSPIGIEMRGQSSFEYDQKPFGFEVRDAAGEGIAVPLLGLPPEADFVLHSCYADKTCLRNALTYAVGREIGAATGRWAPRTRWVEVFIDGRYQGLYLLVERIKRDRSRVNVPAPAPAEGVGARDLSGGYIFSQEGDGGRPGADWPSPFEPRAKLVYRFPRADAITAAQKSYLQSAVRGLAQALSSEKAPGPAVRKLLDVDSFIDYAIVQELTNNVDGYWKSWFFTKAPDAAGGRFSLGPLWDFDIAYGNIIFKKRYCTNTSVSADLVGPFAALYKDAGFAQLQRCRWNVLRAPGGPLDLARLEQKIEAFTRHIARAKTRDQQRWRNIGAWVWPNNYIGETWADEVTYLRYWLRRRLSWLDQNLPGRCATTPVPGPVELIAAPARVVESNQRMPYPGRDAPDYVPIEGPVPAQLASWACPK